MQHSDIAEGNEIFMNNIDFSSLSEYKRHILFNNVINYFINDQKCIRNVYRLFSRCFKIFDIAHALTVTPEAVFIATCDVIKEFHEDNVIYLELRSTPRAVKDSMTKTEYLEAIMKAFE